MTVVRAVRFSLLFLAAWIALGVVLGLLAVRDVQRGIDAAHAARQNLSPADLVEGRPIDDLERARASFAAGHRKSSSIGMAPLRLLPIVGRHVQSVAALSEAAAVVADVGVRAVVDAGKVLDQPQDTGLARIEAVMEIAAVADRAIADLDGLDLGPTNLASPLATRRKDFEDQLIEVRTTLERARDSGNAVGGLLAGPRTYLLMAANNAEMRAGSGMFLSIGTLSISDGEFELGELEPAGDLYIDDASKVPPLTGDLADRWGWLEPNREWRNLGASPRFDANAALAAEMWKAETGEEVDGVLALDAEMLRGVIAATGPVVIDDQVLSDSSVLGYILHDQYADYGDDLDPTSQAPRREQLGRLASAAVDAIESGDFKITELAKQLAGAVAGRHLMAWSARPDEQTGWEAAGVAGVLDESSLMASVINRGGNKLDWFLKTSATMKITPSEAGTDVEVRLTLRNETPEGEVRYVAGPYPDSGVGEGTYSGLVAFTLPGSALDSRVDDVAALAVAGADGPTRVLAVPVEIKRGETKEVVVRFHLPGSTGTMRVESNARIPPTAWSALGDEWAGRSHTVKW
ncbi:MAG: DUF4012 domain-containing protein [Acidimicrobiales bacterium]